MPAKRRKRVKKKGSTPYNILQGMKKKQKERATKEREQSILRGDYVAKKKKRKNNVSRTDYYKNLLGDRRGLRGGVGDGARGFRINSVGKYSNGTLYLTKNDIKSITSTNNNNDNFFDSKPKQTYKNNNNSKKKKKGKKGKKKKGKKKF
eukprot:TRINITY_DN261_c0_g1_i1.p1 TRINITY_DN261_c0_g1~~TRINITY_DN261_c0_g1_i1.p1  ORF type:complete len:149 (+),score=59.83 TRINITY_DN261_c0_g1_i1:727-1173(+)